MAKEEELNILKCLAIVGVIVIHALAAFHTGNLWLDQVMRFSVPLFIALSGYTLGKRYFGEKFTWQYFYRRRLLRILPGYLFWTIVISLVLSIYTGWTGYFVPANWPKMLIFGRTDYQLYFVPLIFSFYLLFPLILFFFKKNRWLTLAGAFLFQIIVFNYLSSRTGIISDQKQYLFFGSWIFYFVLGIFLSQEAPARMKNRLKFIGLAALTGGLGWTIYETYQITGRGIDMIIATRFTKYSVLFFATGAILTAVFFRKLLDRLPKDIFNFLAYLGEISFLIYLSHTLFLRFITGFYYGTPDITVIAFSLFITVLAVIVSFSLHLY